MCDTEDAPTLSTLQIVCPTSAYVRASGNMLHLCAQTLQDDAAADDNRVTNSHNVNLMLVDDSKECVVTVVSENIANIGQEFKMFEDFEFVDAGDIPSLHATCMCAANLIGGLMSIGDAADVILLLNDQRELALSLLGDVVAEARDEGIRTYVTTVDQDFGAGTQDQNCFMLKLTND
ncbi:hypothetical protein CYMTET_2578 [Cymbomonas tetramitiformis]|uniref:Uncharacterized protein n=1 Tax=Cymbomonas tetramitiformis TaxID=36881 RepID=A0AAE0H4Q0_9CHLO|nr:hypothetical protein CYMTET_39623 [Cymbomonas tetramitiformis]KAK3289975.1 hypothetical protein CYMTET_2578 [Cymbomonas tetramitiformis]